MKNWKIGTRIAAGFAAVTVLALALGMFAYGKLTGIEKSSTEVAENALPKLYLAGQIRTNVEVTFALALQPAMAEDNQKMGELDARIQAVRPANAGLESDFEKLVVTEKGRSLLREFRAARDAFRDSLEESLKTSRLGTAEANRRASELLEIRVKTGATHAIAILPLTRRETENL